MKEEWRSILAGGCSVIVSDAGRVMRPARRVKGAVPGTTRLIPEREIVGTILTTGYRQIMLAGRKKWAVHRLVATAFCPGWFDGAVVNHKNGDRLDNRAVNLEWVTQAENNAHAFRVLGRKGSCEGQFSGDHPTSKAIERINPVTGETKRYEAAMDAVREGFLSSQISRYCNGLANSHRGYLWRFSALEAA